MQLIFCRHGETEANKIHAFQGVLDTPLTAKGKEQAEKIHNFLIKKHIDAFLVSPLPRAQATARIIARGFTAPIITTPELTEMSYGDFEGKPKDTFSNEILQQRDANRFHFLHPGLYNGIPGSSYAQLFTKLVPFFQRLEQEYKDKTVVLVSHLGIVLCARKYFEHLSDEEAGKLRIPNNEVFLVDSTEKNVYQTTTLTL